MKQRLRSLKIRPLLFTLLAAGLTLVAACDDDDPGTPTDTSMMDGDAAGDTGVDTGGEDTSGTDTATGDTGQDMADTSGDTTADTTGDTAGDTGVDTSDTMAGDMDADTTGDTTRFTVTIENISNAEGILPSPISPGAWAVHDDSVTFFTADDTASAGFELLAEDGDPSTLSTELDGLSLTGKGVFNTPDGGSMGPAFPGDVYSFEFDVPNTMTGARLSLATMFVQSNDWLLTAPPAGIELFDGTGAAISGDVTDQLGLWDAGTERDQAPGFGLTQAPRQPEGNYGPAEGVVAEWDDTTRATPVAAGILDFSVTESGGTYDITVTNVSTSNALFTPVSPIFWATHDSSASLFTPGSTASAGIEAIAEDGDTSTMDTAADSMSGVDQNGTVATRDSDSSTGPILPNDSYTLSITPTSAGGMLSIATMLVQSNDVLIATKPEGVALLDGSGNPRAAADVEADLRHSIRLWDAGTEVNEPLGVGPNQAPRQAGADTGTEEGGTVELYRDTTNDLDSSTSPLGGLVSITVEHGTAPNSFDVTVTRADDDLGIAVTPAVSVLHDGSVSLFTEGMPASAGLESLAEDGQGATLVGETGGVRMVRGTGPIGPGATDTFTVTAVPATGTHLNLAAMIVPSNDTFYALGETGVQLLDGTNRRTAAAVNADIEAALRAYNAGTEATQASFTGPDMAGTVSMNGMDVPLQSGMDTGPDEGAGVMTTIDTPVFAVPASNEVVRVTVTPSTP